VVGFMVYSQSLFLIARIISGTVLSGHISESALSYSASIIYSTDVIVTTLIYFLPKLKQQPLTKTTSYLDFVSSSVLKRASTGEKRVSSSALECANVSSPETRPHRDLSDSEANRSFSISKCPHCGYSSLCQIDSVQESPEEQLEMTK
jgi:hypothetical protein